jgi:G3E family GTPase
MVTVVDAAHFLRDYRAATSLASQALAAGEEDERTLTDLLVEQVEFADVLLLNKCDLVDESSLARLEALLRQLNPTALVVRTVHGVVDPATILHTGRFRLEEAALHEEWLQEPRYDAIPETEEYGVSSFVFRADRPFHPARLMATLERDFEPVLRSKGFFWLASRPEAVGFWSQAGPQLTADVMVPVAGEDGWEGGTPGQELAIIGLHLDRTQLTRALEEALLTDDELALGPTAWRSFPDPFPTS